MDQALETSFFRTVKILALDQGIKSSFPPVACGDMFTVKKQDDLRCNRNFIFCNSIWALHSRSIKVGHRAQMLEEDTSGSHKGLFQIFLGDAYRTPILKEWANLRWQNLNFKNASVSASENPRNFLVRIFCSRHLGVPVIWTTLAV